jgi:hypothetical protein
VIVVTFINFVKVFVEKRGRSRPFSLLGFLLETGSTSGFDKWGEVD